MTDEEAVRGEMVTPQRVRKVYVQCSHKYEKGGLSPQAWDLQHEIECDGYQEVETRWAVKPADPEFRGAGVLGRVEIWADEPIPAGPYLLVKV